MSIINSCCHFVLAAGCANVVGDDSRLLAIARFTHFRGFEHAMCQKRPCCYTSQNECGIPDLRRNEPTKTLSLGWEPCSLQIFCVHIEREREKIILFKKKLAHLHSKVDITWHPCAANHFCLKPNYFSFACLKVFYVWYFSDVFDDEILVRHRLIHTTALS